MGRQSILMTCVKIVRICLFLSVQIIEQVCSNATDIEEMLWHREKYLQSQLFTTAHGMNSLMTSTVQNISTIGNKFLQQIIFS